MAGDELSGDSLDFSIHHEKDLILDILMRLNRKTKRLRIEFHLGHRVLGSSNHRAVALSAENLDNLLRSAMTLSEQETSTTYVAGFHFDRPEYESVIPLPIPAPGSVSNQLVSNLGSAYVDGLSLAFNKSPIGLDSVRVYLCAEKGIHVDVMLVARQMLDNDLLVRSLQNCSQVAHSFVVSEVTRDTSNG